MDEVRDERRDADIQPNAYDRHRREYGEFPHLVPCPLSLAFCLKRPVFVPKITVHESGGETDALEKRDRCADLDAGDINEQIKKGEVDAGIQEPDGGVFGEAVPEFLPARQEFAEPEAEDENDRYADHADDEPKRCVGPSGDDRKHGDPNERSRNADNDGY